MRRIAAALCVLAMSATASAATDEFVLPSNLTGQTVLYVGAHPDDEWGVTPILADACIDRGAQCRFVVVADGRSYGCLLTIGLRDPEACSRIRRAEMEKAAALFGGSVEFLGLEDMFYAFNEDGMDHVLRDWSTASGGRATLVARFEKILRRERPRMVFTFDPRHGSSCHSGHRAAATLLIEAVRRLPASDRPEVWLEQTTDSEERLPDAGATIAAGGYVGWPDTAASTIWYDATKPLKSGMTGYDYVITERKLHASQVPDEAAGKTVPNPPASARRVPLVRLTEDVAGDYCTRLKLERPTFDISANRKRFKIEP
jgi:LmbE family N-acetylglucosaminyl deacetylase